MIYKRRLFTPSVYSSKMFVKIVALVAAACVLASVADAQYYAAYAPAYGYADAYAPAYAYGAAYGYPAVAGYPAYYGWGSNKGKTDGPVTGPRPTPSLLNNEKH